MTEDQNHLDGLLKHPGWLLFKEYARKEWGDAGYGRKVKLAISDAINKSEDVSIAVGKVDAANDAINDLLSWPSHALQMLETQHARENAPPSLRRA